MAVLPVGVLYNNKSIIKPHLLLESLDTIVLGTDEDSPQYLTGFTALHIDGFEIVDESTGTVKNISGRTLGMVTGTISVDPDKGGGATTQFDLFSERSSDDGLTWQVNPLSRRVVEVSNSGESFKTVVSSVYDWQDDQLIRFRVYRIGGAALSFVSKSTDVLGGQTIVTPSVTWELSEK